MNGLPPAGAVNLGRQQLAIRESRLIALCHLELRAGGLSEPGAVLHLRTVDIPRAEAWLIPIDLAFAHKLHAQLGELIDTIETPTTKED